MFSAERNAGIYNADLGQLAMPSADPLIGLKKVFEVLKFPPLSQIGLVRSDTVIDRSEIRNPPLQGDEVSLKTNLYTMADNPIHYAANKVVGFSRAKALAPQP